MPMLWSQRILDVEGRMSCRHKVEQAVGGDIRAATDPAAAVEIDDCGLWLRFWRGGYELEVLGCVGPILVPTDGFWRFAIPNAKCKCHGSSHEPRHSHGESVTIWRLRYRDPACQLIWSHSGHTNYPARGRSRTVHPDHWRIVWEVANSRDESVLLRRAPVSGQFAAAPNISQAPVRYQLSPNRR